MLFRQIFDERLAQYAYLIGCQRTGDALLIDPERDIDRYFEIAEEEELRIVAVTETHIHAAFLSGAREFAERGVPAYLSAEGGPDWSYAWPEKGSYDIRYLKDGDVFSVGNIDVRTVHTPGHTPEHICFLVTDTGGVMSHSAICAREFAIPCVVGTQLATTTIPDGATITVDGDAGTVTIEG